MIVAWLDRGKVSDYKEKEGVNILAVNYGSPGALPVYPATKTFLKYRELAPRTPIFSEDIGGVEIGDDEGVKPLAERFFWAKYA
ncbi:hypothetical protein L1987_42793 [Smallanthus sonchifolius]|uniref:Uncharacterized protein n=1 Tax=Smallanthus sonchifolius TaxID=185202 RepID=A0ACB9GJY6_9ASTR|nr:hypothetical protein L1987_42793 [Smallanthus sonchifolius]